MQIEQERCYGSQQTKGVDKRMFNDQDGCEWTNASSGTAPPG